MNGAIFINPEDYKELFGTDIYQISVFVKDKYIAQETSKKIAKKGYISLSMKDTFNEDIGSKILRIFSTCVMICLIITVFFICYFVLNIILKSRNTYYATIRMLGANKRISNQLLSIELLVDSTISFFIIIIGAYILRNIETKISFIESINRYLEFNDYLLLLLIISLMSFFISKKYAKKIFKKSAMTTIREGGL